MQKDKTYITVGLNLWIIAFMILFGSKVYHPEWMDKEVALVFLHGEKRTLGSIIYYLCEHVGRILLVGGGVFFLWMLERYEKSSYIRFVKHVGYCMGGIFFVRLIGEIFTHDYIYGWEWWGYSIVIIFFALRLLYLTQQNK